MTLVLTDPLVDSFPGLWEVSHHEHGHPGVVALHVDDLRADSPADVRPHMPRTVFSLNLGGLTDHVVVPDAPVPEFDRLDEFFARLRWLRAWPVSVRSRHPCHPRNLLGHRCRSSGEHRPNDLPRWHSVSAPLRR